jgi:heat-inducible transcriptional repressor
MTSTLHTYQSRGNPELTEREELVLRYIVQHYILTADPVGSRYLSKHLNEESLSAATIRNVMADLEEKGFISHPHTSAGRMPTDRGYRFYVDELMRIETLTQAERSVIRKNINPTAPAPVLLKETSRLLGAISQQLGIVTAPEILESILERLEIVPLASMRLLVVLSLQAGLVRTITLEVHEQVERDQIESIVQVLNERLAGHTLKEIRGSYRDRLSDVAGENAHALVRLFVESADRIFADNEGVERVHISPTQNIFRHPEFASPERLRGIVELIENEEIIIHLLEGHGGETTSVEITIGGELGDERMADYSLITTRYRLGDTTGTIGLIGPKRMNYSKMITVVEYVAKTLTSNFPDR